jgi:hypothetical protein
MLILGMAFVISVVTTLNGSGFVGLPATCQMSVQYSLTQKYFYL